MPRTELIYPILPLLIVTAILCVVELRTGLIPNKIVLPASLCFIVIGCLLGPRPWWHYPLGIWLEMQFGAISIAIILTATCIGGRFFHVESLPSSLLVGISLLIVLGYHFGAELFNSFTAILKGHD